MGPVGDFLERYPSTSISFKRYGIFQSSVPSIPMTHIHPIVAPAKQTLRGHAGACCQVRRSPGHLEKRSYEPRKKTLLLSIIVVV